MNERNEKLHGQIHALVTCQLEGTATEEETRALEQLVADDQEARQIYCTYMQELACLRWSYSHNSWEIVDDLLAEAEPMKGSVATQRRVVRLAAWGALAAALLLMTGVSLYQGRNQGDNVFPQPLELVAAAPTSPQQSVAMLARVSDPVWSTSCVPLAELSRLSAGQILALDAGQAEIIFDSGVEVIITGPMRFEIRSAHSASCNLGTISARVSEQGKGFTIETPSASVIDLGTEFGLTVSAAGETEVAVFRGIVDLALDPKLKNRPLRQWQRLNQGEALRVSKNGEVNRVVSITSDDFPVAAANRVPKSDRSPVISTVRDNIRSPGSNKYYRIVRGGLREDALAFVDRDHQWNGIDDGGIPAELLDSEYVMLFNDDKFVKDLKVSVALSRPAVLYLMVSDAVPIPDWLTRDFVATNMDIGLDEAKSRYHKQLETELGAGKSIDTLFSVWKRVVSVPSTVTLGAVDRPDPPLGYNMYGIAAVPLD